MANSFITYLPVTVTQVPRSSLSKPEIAAPFRSVASHGQDRRGRHRRIDKNYLRFVIRTQDRLAGLDLHRSRPRHLARQDHRLLTDCLKARASRQVSEMLINASA